jgi:choline dehydrogenase-like flavoprotein
MTSPSGKRYDALVIGSGAAGSIAVKELTEGGLEVLLLEAGRDITEADFKPPPETQPQAMGISLAARVNAGLHGQYTQARRVMFKSSTSPFLVNDLEHPYSTEGDYFLWIRGQQLGGRLHSCGRMLLRSSDHEFKAASYDGHGEDWPISYADLEPYYARIEEFFGIYGTAEGVENLPDGKYVGPARLSAAEEEFKAKVESYWPGWHVIPWRYVAPNLDRIPLGILAARQTGRLATRTDAIVRQITVNPKTGRADGAIFTDRLTKTEHRVEADVVVLCASTIESIRLLFNSACQGHPNGLGNSSGLLGRYFMDQTPSLLFASAILRWGFRKSLAIGAAIHECGGARMGRDPARSVLNEYNQSWDVPNLFVTDASCYSSTGAVGPTLTIVALTARACEHIAREQAGGRL